MKLATVEQANEARKEVKRWLDEDRGAWMYEDMTSLVSRLVSEYVLNKEGLTMWTDKATEK